MAGNFFFVILSSKVSIHLYENQCALDSGLYILLFSCPFLCIVLSFDLILYTAYIFFINDLFLFPMSNLFPFLFAYCKRGNICGTLIFTNFAQNSASANSKTRENICDILYAHLGHVGVVY